MKKQLALLVSGLVVVLVLCGQLARAAGSARLPIVASQDFWPVFAPDGEKLAFTRIEQRTMTLEVVDLFHRRTVRIAANQGQLSPSWSSDGRLAFSLGGKVYTSDWDGANRTPAFTGLAPAWRPKSSDLAYIEGTELWVNGARWAGSAFGKPAWSPDGTQLAFQRSDGIYVTSGPGAERKVAASVGEPGQPLWSPDGTQLAFTAQNRVWVSPVDGSRGPRAVSSTFADLSAPTWSRENDAVAYTGNGAVWLTFLDGHTSRLIEGGVAGASFSPVADILAFAGTRKGCASHTSIRVYYDNEFNGPVSGTCAIPGTAANDVIDGTSAGGDAIAAGAGNDVVHARNRHRDVVDCGAGRDVAVVDRADVVRNCEIVRRP
jgi:Tol biopolymer transport system component